MAIPETSAMKEHARRAYERGRVRHGLLSALPVLVIVALACAIDHTWLPTLPIGLALYAAAAFLFFRGRALGRGVLPGIAAGAVPFVAIHLARMHGHVCTGTACFSMCMPACVAGGVIAGLVVARIARRSTAPTATWAAGGAIAALTGSLGCACIGIGGIAGLVGGLLVGSIPLVFRPAAPPAI